MKKTIIYVIIFLLYGFIVHKISTLESYKENMESIQAKDITIDSLKGEIQVLEMTLDSQDWIIEQARDKHPKDMEKIINESE